MKYKFTSPLSENMSISHQNFKALFFNHGSAVPWCASGIVQEWCKSVNFFAMPWQSLHRKLSTINYDNRNVISFVIKSSFLYTGNTDCDTI